MIPEERSRRQDPESRRHSQTMSSHQRWSPPTRFCPSLIATASAEGCLGFIVMMRAFSKSKSGFAGVCVNAEGIGANKAVTGEQAESLHKCSSDRPGLELIAVRRV